MTTTIDYNQLALDLHSRCRGKIEITSKVPLASRDDLSTAYTPGVAEPCRRIAGDPALVYDYTAKGNLVAVVSDGSAVLGLGNIGAQAALPVMEGKAILFKKFAGIDAFPICLATQDDEEIIRTVRLLAPSFGGINLEDIAAPRCFYIEQRLKEELDIPVFHDDQHGTAVCVLAALLNASRLTGKDLGRTKIVINGIGAAGVAITKILLARGIKNILLVDKQGILNIDQEETMLNWMHRKMAKITNLAGEKGGLGVALQGADIFIGVSAPAIVSPAMVAGMNDKAVVLALANPLPEIFPAEALAAGAMIVGTGRSDFPNQVNNVLAFPGIFRGAFDVRAREINEEMKLAAAVALADFIPPGQLNTENIIPSTLTSGVAEAVAQAVAQTALTSGTAQISSVRSYHL
jgi:malate dehydrogenase (oxaloacetate-decarboxylating)